MNGITEKEEIFNEIKKLLIDNFSIPNENISMDSTFPELDMDSLETLDLINELEQIHHIAIENKELSKIKTISNVVEYMVERIKNHSIK
jgi:acyl carrier protein